MNSEIRNVLFSFVLILVMVTIVPSVSTAESLPKQDRIDIFVMTVNSAADNVEGLSLSCDYLEENDTIYLSSTYIISSHTFNAADDDTIDKAHTLFNEVVNFIVDAKSKLSLEDIPVVAIAFTNDKIPVFASYNGVDMTLSLDD